MTAKVLQKKREKRKAGRRERLRERDSNFKRLYFHSIAKQGLDGFLKARPATSVPPVRSLRLPTPWGLR